MDKRAPMPDYLAPDAMEIVVISHGVLCQSTTGTNSFKRNDNPEWFD